LMRLSIRMIRPVCMRTPAVAPQRTTAVGAWNAIRRAFTTTSGGQKNSNSKCIYHARNLLSLPAASSSSPFAPPHRTIFHLPVLGMAGKLLAFITLKKLAIVAIINKLGITRTFQIFREINQGLLNHKNITGGIYNQTMYDGINSGLDVLEKSLKNLAPQEHAQKVYNWFKDLSTSNQPFVQAVLKAYMDMFPAIQWMKQTLGFEVSPKVAGEAAVKEAQELAKQVSQDAAAIALIEAELQKAVSVEDWNACVKLRDDMQAIIQKKATEKDVKASA